MLKQFELRILAGAIIIAVLFIGGIYLYSKWNYNRFSADLGGSPTSTPATSTTGSQSALVNKTDPSTVQDKRLLEKVNINSTDINHQPSDETKQEDTSEPSPEFDPSQLLSAFGMPEEVKSLLDENAEEKDFEKAQKHLTETYGDSPEVEAIMDKLKQMSGGTVELDDLTELFEAWIQVLPEEQQENRRQLMGVLNVLNQAKAQGDNVPVKVMVGTDLDPSMLEGDNVKRFEIVTTDTEVIDVKTKREIIDD